MTIAILGASGFVGSNVAEVLAAEFHCIKASRNAVDDPSTNSYHFDCCDRNSWQWLAVLKPDAIINCIGYGVVKEEQDARQLFAVNYFESIRLYDFIAETLPETYLIHTGTAFEYALEQQALTESSVCIPRTAYGASKLLASQYLLTGNSVKQFTVVRPFNMFGPYEHGSKIVPALIRAQLNSTPVPLSQGNQERDYFYVRDFSALLGKLIRLAEKPRLLNAGSGTLTSIRSLAQQLQPLLHPFDAGNWQWGALPERSGEADAFYNASTLARSLGMPQTPLKKALEETINYYSHVEKP